MSRSKNITYIYGRKRIVDMEDGDFGFVPVGCIHLCAARGFMIDAHWEIEDTGTDTIAVRVWKVDGKVWFDPAPWEFVIYERDEFEAGRTWAILHVPDELNEARFREKAVEHAARLLVAAGLLPEGMELQARLAGQIVSEGSKLFQYFSKVLAD